MGIVITIVILVIVGFFVWMKVIKPQMGVKYNDLHAEAQKEFDENGEAMIAEAFENPEKFGIFKKVIPEDEKIVAIASFMEPRSVGKNLLGEAATSITGVLKVNMSLFYFILTDKNLHAVAFNGENSVSHDIFDLNDINSIKITKGAGGYGAGMKDALSGVSGGNYTKMVFDYKGKKYEYNLNQVIEGYPIFTVEKDFNGQFYRVYTAVGPKSDIYNYKHKDFYLDSQFRTKLYDNFKKGIGERYGVEFPA